MAFDARRLMAARQAASSEEEGDTLHPPKGIKAMPKGIRMMPRGIKEEPSSSNPSTPGSKKKVGNPVMRGAIERRMAKNNATNSKKQEEDIVSKRKMVGY